MLLKFVKRRTLEDTVGASGSKLKCDSFSLTVPPDAVVGKAVRISFTWYEYQPEASEGVDESHITDLVVLHPCGEHFAKEVELRFDMEHVLLSEEVNAFLLYEERRAGSFIPSPVEVSTSSVYGDMTAVLHRSSLDVNTNHFCKFFACLLGCVGHCYRTLAYGRWAKGEALRSQATAAIDIFFTSSRPSHVDFVERCHRGMPVLLNGNATIYFPKRGRFTLDVAKVSDGWELVSPAAISIEKEELVQAKRHSSKFLTRSFVLKKSADDAGELWLEIHLTDDVKTNCIFSLKEYAALHVGLGLVSIVLAKCLFFRVHALRRLQWTKVRRRMHALLFFLLPYTGCFRMFLDDVSESTRYITNDSSNLLYTFEYDCAFSMQRLIFAEFRQAKNSSIYRSESSVNGNSSLGISTSEIQLI